jgi:hypothetical protein
MEFHSMRPHPGLVGSRREPHSGCYIADTLAPQVFLGRGACRRISDPGFPVHALRIAVLPNRAGASGVVRPAGRAHRTEAGPAGQPRQAILERGVRGARSRVAGFRSSDRSARGWAGRRMVSRGSRTGRPHPVARPHDLAARIGPGGSCRTALPGDDDPCRASIPLRSLSRSPRGHL